MTDEEAGARWLILVYQFPKGPGSPRVKVWRRLQGIGAVALKHSVYALPFSEQSQEDFHWLLGELTAGGGDGAILESKFIDGMTDQQVRILFNTARESDYAGLRDELRAAIDAFAGDADALADALRSLVRAKKRLAEIVSIDFFDAEGRQAADALIRDLNESIASGPDPGPSRVLESGGIATADLKNRVWVTRRDVHVDRIASAWLIRRWIDATARFRFVAVKDYAAKKNELRFDMYNGEFTHEGDSCTFEVLARRIRPDDTALRSVAEVVHDIDLKDDKFARAETAGIANLLAGTVLNVDDDERRIERGGAMFDDLYRFFSEQRP